MGAWADLIVLPFSGEKEDAVEADSVLFLKIYLVGEVVLVVLVEMIFCMNVILL